MHSCKLNTLRPFRMHILMVWWGQKARSMAFGDIHRKVQVEQFQESYNQGMFKKTSFLFFFGHTHGMRKFLGQGWNLGHSSNSSDSSDNTRSLTH